MQQIFSLAAALIGLGILGAAEANAQAIDVSLVGKVCRGTFDTGTGGATSRGSLHIRFPEKEGAPEIRITNSAEAYARPLEAPEPRTVKTFSTDGRKLTVIDVLDVHWNLSYSPADNKLTGELDPTYNPARARWKVAKVEMVCDSTPASASGK